MSPMYLRFTSSLSFHSTSAPTNAAETMPVAKPILLDKEVVDIGALAQQLMNVQAKNMRIEQRKRDWAVQEKKNKEQGKKDEVDRLT